MTGERPVDDDALEPEADGLEPDEAAEADVDADAELDAEADADADADVDTRADVDAEADEGTEDTVQTSAPSETAGEEDLEVRERADAPPGAPFAAARASERLSGPTRPAVVPDAKARSVASDEDLPYIDDRVSRYWVIAIGAVFLLILIWGIFGGKSGLLSAPPPTEEPLPTNTPALTRAPSPATSISPSVAPSGLTSAAPSTLQSAAPSPAPSAAPSSAPSAAAS